MDNGMDAVEETETKELRVTLHKSGGELDIIVADTGNGMNQDNLSIIFAKGYSTKGEHRGLGLWLVLKAVDTFNGSIDIETHPGKGTTVHVRLPAAELFGDVSC